MKVRFVINPIAGGRNNMAAEVTGAVRKSLADVDGIFEIKVAKSGEHVTELAREAAKKGYELVVACGGDGTINRVATPLVGTNTALGVIPAGSGNGFARALNIPTDILAAVELVKTRKLRGIDVGSICGRYFFSTAGCGFDAHLSMKYHNGFFSKIRGVLPYYPMAMYEYLRYKIKPVTIKIGNNVIEQMPFLITAANTGYYGGKAMIAPGAEPDDGLLDLCIITPPGFLKAVAMASKLLSGKIESFSGFSTLRADLIEIFKAGSTYVHADGEPFEWAGDIVISVMRRKIMVLAPPHAA